MKPRIIVEIKADGDVRCWGAYTDKEFLQDMWQLYGFIYKQWNYYTAKDVFGAIENCPDELAEILLNKQVAVQFGCGENLKYLPANSAPDAIKAAYDVLFKKSRACFVLSVDEAKSIVAGEHDHKGSFGGELDNVKRKVGGVLKNKFFYSP